MKATEMSSTDFKRMLEEALYHTIYASGVQLKEISYRLDVKASQLSMMASGYEGNRFPLVWVLDLMEITGDETILKTLARSRGYELKAMVRDPAELAKKLDALAEGVRELQTQFMVPMAPAKKRGKR